VKGVYVAYLPSPSQGVWHLGPLPIRAYALCIILGIVAAVWIGERRYVARGGQPGVVMDVAVWATIFGLVGGRLYHVLTDPELYFGSGKDPVEALKIWKGGLGIWGAISLGALGAWLGCRRNNVRLAPFADAAAPGIAVAQAIGRWGNYFNQELFGRPTTLPWGLKIDPTKDGAVPGAVAYHPTFLYESLWDLLVAGLVVLADRRFKLGRGRAFALYVMAYTVGRFWIEALRTDHANRLGPLRLNDWTSILVFIAALVFFLLRRGPRETPDHLTLTPTEAAPTAEAESAPDAEPIAEGEPVAEAEPSAEAEGEPEREPVAGAKSAAGGGPSAEADPVVGTEPSTETEAPSDAEAVVAEADPVAADAEAVAESGSSTAGAAATSEPVAEAEPVGGGEAEVGEGVATPPKAR
jgi:phosphatidylglycerol---prolipoprotein diacylglyceryl transferase